CARYTTGRENDPMGPALCIATCSRLQDLIQVSQSKEIRARNGNRSLSDAAYWATKRASRRSEIPIGDGSLRRRSANRNGPRGHWTGIRPIKHERRYWLLPAESHLTRQRCILVVQNGNPA